MADLGAVGMLHAQQVIMPLDTAFAQDITVNPVRVINASSYRARPYLQDWGTISGIVRDVNGAPAARKVSLFLRATCELVWSGTSDAGSGSYAASTPYPDDEHIRVAFDDATTDPLLNDLIDRVMPG